MVAVAGLSVMSYLAIHRTPDWYQPDTRSEAQRNKAADRLEDLYHLLITWGQKKHYEQPGVIDAHSAQQAVSILSHKADESFPISFTDDELNALFNKWENTKDRREWFDQYVEDPRLVIRGRQLIFVGKVKSMDLVVSLIFEPQLNPQGQLEMKLVHVLGGILPLPEPLWAGRRESIEKLLLRKQPDFQGGANISSDGVANGDAASAAMNRLLLATLQYKPTDAVIFVPLDPLGVKLTKSLPVKITAIHMHDHTLEMTAEQMTPEERGELLKELKGTQKPAAP
jgi:hypothetical protein